MQYDYSVRDDADGSLIQYQYGEDALDVTSVPYLMNFSFMADNEERLKQHLKLQEATDAGEVAGLQKIEKKIRKSEGYSCFNSPSVLWMVCSSIVCSH